MKQKLKKAFRLLTRIVKRYLSAAVSASRPGAVVNGPSLHNTRLGGVRLWSPHQHADPGGGTEKPKYMQDMQESVQYLMQSCAVGAPFGSFMHLSFFSVS